MQPRTVFLLPSEELGWVELRQALERMPDVRIVGEGIRRTDVLTMIARLRPDLVLAAAVREGRSTIPLFHQLRHVRQVVTRVVLLTTHFDPADARALLHAGITGCLLWGDLQTRTLPACLDLLLTGGVSINSETVTQAIATVCIAAPPPALIALTARERAVLAGLAAGMTHREVAVAAGISARTVKRSVSDLERQLGVATPFAMGKRAAQLGLIGE